MRFSVDRIVVSVLLSLLLLAGSATACEMCNCYLGINPNYNQHMIGVNFRHRVYQGVHVHQASDGHNHVHPGEVTPTIRENFQTTDLNLRLYPLPELQLFVNLPYSYNYIETNGMVTDVIKGFGDAFILGQYQVLNTMPDSDNVRHRVFVGGGVKAPSGVYDKPSDDGEIEAHYQPGTGTWDLLLAGSYLLKWRQWGASSDVTFRTGRKNDLGYHMGDRFNVNTSIFHQFVVKDWTMLPSLGAFFEQAGEDKQDELTVSNTGGWGVLGSAGFDLYYGRTSLHLAGQLPLAQDLVGTQTENKFRLIAGLQFAFR
ncbi:MAG TPA: hypothetical protein PLI08_01885 [Bacteroidia bacterium]|nr:hypothetical protein [Bacteroidia bacterium]